MGGVITFGWGVRPADTIKKLFPKLPCVEGSEDPTDKIARHYLEIGKLCLLDELPKNSESRFISSAMKFLKHLRPELKLVFTWADAIWGKPGYIYQATNFLFGGYTDSEAYRTEDLQRLHPRQLHKYLISIGEITKDNRGERVTREDVLKNPEKGIGNWEPNDSSKSGVRRPYPPDMLRLKLSHIRGMQFRYVHFLCPKPEQKKLLSESETHWHTDYPKTDSCQWSIKRPGASSWDHEWNPLKLGEPIFSGAFDIQKEKI